MCERKQDIEQPYRIQFYKKVPLILREGAPPLDTYGLYSVKKYVFFSTSLFIPLSCRMFKKKLHSSQENAALDRAYDFMALRDWSISLGIVTAFRLLFSDFCVCTTYKPTSYTSIYANLFLCFSFFFFLFLFCVHGRAAYKITMLRSRNKQERNFRIYNNVRMHPRSQSVPVILKISFIGILYINYYFAAFCSKKARISP